MPTPTLQAPQTAEFADLWYETRALTGHPLPAKEDFPLRKLARFMPNMTLQEADATGRLRYTLFGTALSGNFGRDMTGDYVDAPMERDARAARQASLDAYFAEHGEDAPYGRWLLGEAQTNTGRVVQFESIALPYRHTAGPGRRLISHVLWLGTLDYGESLPPSFAEKHVRMFLPTGPRPDWLHQDPESSLLSATDVA